MRLTHLTLCASLAALAACSDSPITQAEPTDLYDLSAVTLLSPDQYAAHGIESLPPSGPSVQGPSYLIQDPCQIDDPDSCGGGEPPAPGLARVDYWGGVFNESSCCTKRVRLHAKSDAHNDMYKTTLTVSFRSVGGQGTSGCYATPAQFDSETKTAYGAPVHVESERYASYANTMTFVWEVKSSHYFSANAGFVLANGYRTYTFPSGGRLCV